jgi:SUKH-4 immunity protein
MDFERYGCAVILTDDAIANVLAPVVAGELVVPYPGAWARPPYESRAGRPVIAHDPGLSAIVVDRDRDTVILMDTNGEAVLNASLAVFVECARRYTAAIHTPDADDDSWETIGRELLAQIRAIDPDAADGEDRFWAVAAEEVGYGIHAVSPSRVTRWPIERSKTQLLLAMADEQRDAAFTAEQWRRLAAAADVTVAPPLHRLGLALDAMAQMAPLRGRPVPRPEVLVCGGYPGGSVGELDRDLLDRLPALRLICHLTGSDVPPRAPRAPGVPTVVIENSDPALAILAAMAAQGL